MDDRNLLDEEKQLLDIGTQSAGEIPCSSYKIDYKRPSADLCSTTSIVSNLAVKRMSIMPSTKESCISYQQIDTLAETDNSRSSTGYMNHPSEYKTSYFKQHNVENSVPRLHKNVEELFTNYKDFAHMPKPQLVKAPYASMSLDAMPLLTKKKLLEKYYESVKTYYMEDNSLIKRKEHLQLKTLEDICYEKKHLTLNISDLHTNDEIEIIAPLFYKNHSDIKQICGLQAEILKLSNRSKLNTIKQGIERKEEDINKKIERNVRLQKEFKLRLPYKRDYGFTGCYPPEATHDEAVSATKYPLFRTMNGVVEEQYRRRKSLELFNTDLLKYRVECIDSKKVPICLPINKLSI